MKHQPVTSVRQRFRVRGYDGNARSLMVQNHLIQLLCLVAMEPPTDLSADSIRDEKVKVVRSLHRWPRSEIATNVVRGQYTKGAIHGEPVLGYRQEQNVNPDSQTETFVALRLFIDNWRWADVPVYMRVGKRLPKSATEISIHFKKAPAVLFNKDLRDLNVLVIRIQPDEGISLRIHAITVTEEAVTLPHSFLVRTKNEFGSSERAHQHQQSRTR